MFSGVGAGDIFIEIEMLSAIRFRLSSKVVWATLALFVAVGVAVPWLPDYESYREIYVSAGGHLAAFGRDLGFVVVVQLLEPVLAYEQFRYATLILTAAITIYSMKRLQLFVPYKLGPSLVLVLTPLVFLKFGVQVREGIALCLWIAMIAAHARTPNLLVFLSVALLSISVHLAIAPFWVLLFLALYFRRFSHAGMMVSIVLYSTFVYMVADVSRLESEIFSGLSKEGVDPDFFQVLYWLFFPIIFLSSLFQGEFRYSFDAEVSQPLRALAFVLKAAMVGFIVGIFVQIGVNDFSIMQKGVVSDLLRIAALLLMLNCIYLVVSGSVRKAVWISCFLIGDTIRIILAA